MYVVSPAELYYKVLGTEEEWSNVSATIGSHSSYLAVRQLLVHVRVNQRQACGTHNYENQIANIKLQLYI